MKTYILQFFIDETAISGGWENPYQLAVKLKLLLENRYGYEQVADVQPAEKPKPVRTFCLVKKQGAEFP